MEHLRKRSFGCDFWVKIGILTPYLALLLHFHVTNACLYIGHKKRTEIDFLWAKLHGSIFLFPMILCLLGEINRKARSLPSHLNITKQLCL